MRDSLSKPQSLWPTNITTFLALCSFSWWAALLSNLLFPNLVQVNGWLVIVGLAVTPLYLGYGLMVYLGRLAVRAYRRARSPDGDASTSPVPSRRR